MSYFMVDVEADGPIPGDYSMVAIGAVVVDATLERRFYGKLKAMTDSWLPAALEVCGFSREETLTFDDPQQVMEQFEAWIQQESKGKPFFVADNAGFDWQFINYYFHHFLGHNPFGYNSTHLGSLYKGMVGDVFQGFRHLRKTPHTHHPVDDAMGDAEALCHMKKEMGLKIPLK